MLTEEKIKKNYVKFMETAEKYGVMNDKLVDLLGIDFINAPCTTSTHMTNAFPGGLILHILNTTKYAIFINNSLSESKRVNEETLIRVSLLHQIGKAKMFVPQTSEWHKKNNGEVYKFSDDNLPLTMGERSIYYILSSGITLTEDEVFAIQHHNSEFNNHKNNGTAEKLASILKSANIISNLEEK